MGYEQQEAVISANYLDKDTTNADAVEFDISVNDVNDIDEVLNKVGISDYTIDISRKIHLLMRTI